MNIIESIEKNKTIDFFKLNEIQKKEFNEISSSPNTFPTFASMDFFLEEMQKNGLCDQVGVFTKDPLTIDNQPLTVDNKLVLKDEIIKGIKEKLDKFLDEPVSLFSRGFNKLKKETVPVDLGIKFTVRDLLVYCGVPSDSAAAVLAGSGLYHFLPEVLRETFKKIRLGEATLDKMYSEKQWEEIESQLREIPADFDLRIYLEELPKIDKGKILEHIDAFFASIFFKAEQEILEAKKQKHIKQEKETVKISKQGAIKYLKEHGYEKIPKLEGEKFWLYFVKKAIYVKRVSPDSSTGMGIIQVGNGKDLNIELVFMDWANRYSIYSESSLEVVLMTGEIRLNKRVSKDMGYTVLQCLVDKALDLLRSMQKKETIISLGESSDWKTFIYKISRKYRSLDPSMGKDAFDALLKKFESYKRERPKEVWNSQHKGKENYFVDFIIKLAEDIVKSHYKKRVSSNLAIAMNIHTFMPTIIKEEERKAILEKLLDKMNGSQLSKEGELLKSMLRKYPFAEVSAYLQLLGFLSLALFNNKCSYFTTVNHSGKTHLQIFLNDKKDAVLLPLDISSSLKLLMNNCKILSENEELTSILLNMKGFLFHPLLKPLVAEHADLLQNLLKSLQTEQNLLYRSIQLLLSSYDVQCECDIEEVLISLPERSYSEILFELTSPFLTKKPYELSEEQIKKLREIVDIKDLTLRCKGWVLSLLEITSLKKTGKKSLAAFLKNPKLSKMKTKDFFNQLFKQWKEGKSWNSFCQFLSHKETEKVYTDFPSELLELWLEAYSHIEQNKKILIAGKVAKLCESPKVMKNAQKIKGKEEFKEIISLLIAAHHEKQATTIVNLLYLVDPLTWKQLFEEKIPLETLENWWAFTESKLSSVEQKTIFIDVGLLLVEKSVSSESLLSKAWSLKILTKIKKQKLSEQQKSCLKQILQKKMIARSQGIEEDIGLSLLEDEDSFELFFLLLGHYADHKDTQRFVDLLSKNLFKNYGDFCVKTKYSESIISHVLNIFSHLSYSQCCVLLSKESRIRINFLRNQQGVQLLLERCKDSNASFEDRESLLWNILDKTSPLYADVSSWLDVVTFSLEKKIKKSLFNPYEHALKECLDPIVFSLLEKENHKILSFIISCDSCHIAVNLSKETLQKLFVFLERNLIEEEIDQIYEVFGILARQKLQISFKDVSGIVDTLMNFYTAHRLERAANIIDIVLEMFPELLSNVETPLLKGWASNMEIKQDFVIWERWINKIAKENSWSSHTEKYLKLLFEKEGVENFLGKLPNDIEKQTRNSLLLEIFTRNDFSDKECLQWMKGLEKRNIFDKEIWGSFAFHILRRKNSILFDKICPILKKYPEIVAYFQENFDEAVKIKLVDGVSQENFFLVPEVLLSPIYCEKLSKNELSILLEKSFALYEQTTNQKNAFPLVLEKIEQLLRSMKLNNLELDVLDLIMLKAYVIDSKGVKNKKNERRQIKFESSVKHVNNIISRKEKKSLPPEKYGEVFFECFHCWRSFLEESPISKEKNSYVFFKDLIERLDLMCDFYYRETVLEIIEKKSDSIEICKINDNVFLYIVKTFKMILLTTFVKDKDKAEKYVLPEIKKLICFPKLNEKSLMPWYALLETQMETHIFFKMFKSEKYFNFIFHKEENGWLSKEIVFNLRYKYQFHQLKNFDFNPPVKKNQEEIEKWRSLIENILFNLTDLSVNLELENLSSFLSLFFSSLAKYALHGDQIRWVYSSLNEVFEKLEKENECMIEFKIKYRYLFVSSLSCEILEYIKFHQLNKRSELLLLNANKEVVPFSLTSFSLCMKYMIEWIQEGFEFNKIDYLIPLTEAMDHLLAHQFESDYWDYIKEYEECFNKMPWDKISSCVDSVHGVSVFKYFKNFGHFVRNNQNRFEKVKVYNAEFVIESLRRIYNSLIRFVLNDTKKK